MSRPHPLLACLPVLILAGCTTPAPPEDPMRTDPSPSTLDPHSFADSQATPLEHLTLDLVVDFETRRLTGTAAWTLGPHQASRLILDTIDLDVIEVVLDAGRPTSWYLAPGLEHLGRPLVVDIQPATTTVTISYATSLGADALQWLAPTQTADGQRPFLFSQSQATLARSWVPCPDSPRARFTWEATVRAPADLEVLMSAERVEATPAGAPTEQRVFRFRMEHPVPAYLLAIAAGRLERRELGPRTAVWAEPSLVEAAAAEFADVEAMVGQVEALYGPYRWGRYDLLVLPPSFPFGGMENPMMTFATPTIIAGDRSLVSLIAHELAHSWSGNLVTNATWDDFWLNEGFTVYLERRIMEALEGPAYAEMLASLGREDLDDTLADLGVGSPDSHLRLDLAGRNADDGMTDVAYEKGYLFLRRIEEAVGRERFDPFLSSWFDEHAFQSATTDEFLGFLRQRLPEAAETVDFAAWVDGPGLPAETPVIESVRLAAAEDAAAKVAGGASPRSLATAEWSAHEWIRFLRALPRPLPVERMQALDAAYSFTASRNSEILVVWLEHAIASGYQPAQPALEEFLLRVGRRKFLRPLYQALLDAPGGRERALAIYTKARPGYHPVATRSIDELLGWPADAASPAG